MEITYNIQTIYTYRNENMPEDSTKVYRFSRKVSRRIWKYALSTPDFRSFLEAKSRECSDTISRMNQELRNVVVTFHISFNGDTPFVGSAVCFFKTVSGGELRCTMGGSSVTLSAYLKDDRKMSTDEVIDKWTRETENYKDISVTMEQGSTTSSSMSSTNQIEVDLQSTDYDALKKASDELVEELLKEYIKNRSWENR